MEKRFTNPLDENKYHDRLHPRAEDARGVFYKDQAVIIHSLPFRRLKHKAQVFLDPNNDHVCTRIEHAFHVATIAASICRGLGLDEQVAYAIGLAHDLGHAPFGHPGEDVLKERTNSIGEFIHEIHGLRIVDILGNRGVSLNLSYIVRDGVVCHCGENPDKELEPRTEELDLSKIQQKGLIPCSYEGCVTRLSDKIAYLGRDLEDAIYGGFIKRSDIPKQIENELGSSNGEIIDTLVLDVIDTSLKKGKVSFSEEKFKLIEKLYDFSKTKIYNHEALIRYQSFCKRIIEQLFDYLLDIYNDCGKNFEIYFNSPVPLDKRFGRYLKQMKTIYEKESWIPNRIIADYIAGMTDGYALRCMREISLPEELSFD